jgi:hypothetical protein
MRVVCGGQRIVLTWPNMSGRATLGPRCLLTCACFVPPMSCGESTLSPHGLRRGADASMCFSVTHFLSYGRRSPSAHLLSLSHQSFTTPGPLAFEDPCATRLAYHAIPADVHWSIVRAHSYLSTLRACIPSLSASTTPNPRSAFTTIIQLFTSVRITSPSLTMSNESNSPPLHSPAAIDRRRASVTAQTFQDLFGRSSNHSGQQGGVTPGSGSGPITSAAVNAQRRRLSLTTIGLSAAPGQTSPFQNPRTRTESISSVNSGSVDESPFEDDYNLSTSATSSNPATPFARRLSFGARALRDVRQSNGSVGIPNGRPSIHKASSPPTGRGRGLSSLSRSLPSPSRLVTPFCSDSLSVWPPATTEPVHRVSEDHVLTPLPGEGYNFAENLRSRAERGSMSGPAPMQNGHGHQRAKSVAIMEPPTREMPKQPKVPDAMQERILKGDFYMD